jgi:hypothetical protein
MEICHVFKDSKNETVNAVNADERRHIMQRSDDLVE